MKLKAKLIAITLTAVLTASTFTAHANGSTASVRASENLSSASGLVVAGSASLFVASGELIVVGIEQSAKGVSVVLKGVGQVSGEAVTLLVDGVAASTLVVGNLLQASVTAAGTVLIAAGKAVAFIPNEIGRSLIHQSSYSR